MTSLPDSNELKKILLSITRDLDSSILERRLNQTSHKKNPSEELRIAFSELSTREQDLKAAAGISLMLLQTNEELQEKLLKAEEKVQKIKGKCHHYQIQTESLLEALKSSEEKIETLKNSLIEAENSIFFQAQQIDLLQNTKGKTLNFAENDQIELQKKSEFLNKRNEELEKSSNKLKESLKVLERRLKETSERNKDLEEKLNMSYQKVEVHRLRHHSLRIELENTEKDKQVCENLLQEAKLTIQKLKNYSEKLEEDVVIKEKQTSSPAKEKKLSDSNLFLELSLLENEDIEEIEKAFESDFWKLKSPSNQIHSKLTITTNKISVLPVTQKKKPNLEEFFFLTSELIKKNSKFLDGIKKIPTTQLYLKACQDKIPFDKWTEWIAGQLKVLYIGLVHKKK